ncbi:MAG: DUF6471 domain-containing protein [Shewanella sp.]
MSNNPPEEPQPAAKSDSEGSKTLTKLDSSEAESLKELAEIGVVDSEPNVRNKLSRGKFTAVFLLQCLEAIGVNTLRLQD